VFEKRFENIDDGFLLVLGDDVPYSLQREELLLLLSLVFVVAAGKAGEPALPCNPRRATCGGLTTCGGAGSRPERLP